MEIPEFTLVGFLTVYVVQGFVFAFFVIIAYKILKRSKKQENLILSSFFISASIGLFINFIYVLLVNELIVLILYYMTLFFIFLAPIFFLIFNLIILKSGKIFTKSKQKIITAIYGLIIFCMIFISNGITINESTNWQPIWSFVFFIYLVMVVSIFAVAPGIYFSIKIYIKFSHSVLKKRWAFYLIGVFFIYFLMYAIMTSNFLDNPLIRSIIGLFGIVFSIIGSLLIYYGVGKMEDLE